MLWETVFYTAPVLGDATLELLFSTSSAQKFCALRTRIVYTAGAELLKGQHLAALEVYKKSVCHFSGSSLLRRVTEGGGFHTAVRGTMFVRNGPDRHASATSPSLSTDDQNLRNNGMTAQWRRRMQSGTVPSSRDTRMSFPQVKAHSL